MEKTTNLMERLAGIPKELRRAERLLNLVLYALSYNRMDLIQKLNVYAHQMSHFDILDGESKHWLTYLQQVCSNELSVEDAYILFSNCAEQVKKDSKDFQCYYSKSKKGVKYFK